MNSIDVPELLTHSDSVASMKAVSVHVYVNNKTADQLACPQRIRFTPAV